MRQEREIPLSLFILYEARCTVGTVLGGLLLVKIPMVQGYRDAQSDKFTAAVMGEYKGKRG